MASGDPPSGVDATKAHPARRYNYWLGGRDNFAIDRESGDAIEARFPGIRIAAQQNRFFLRRVVRYLVKEAGIRQFLDIGTGLPSAGNTHEVAQGIAPESRIVYVDNDPLVLAHARALLTSTPLGRTGYIHADLREPDAILAADTLRASLDLSKPVAVLMIAVLHFLPDDRKAAAAVQALMDPMPPGSYLALSHATADLMSPASVKSLNEDDYPGAGDITFRTRAQTTTFFAGLELVRPGVQIVSDWRPDAGVARPPRKQVSVWGGLARKPFSSR